MVLPHSDHLEPAKMLPTINQNIVRTESVLLQHLIHPISQTGNPSVLIWPNFSGLWQFSVDSWFPSKLCNRVSSTKLILHVSVFFPLTIGITAMHVPFLTLCLHWKLGKSLITFTQGKCSVLFTLNHLSKVVYALFTYTLKIKVKKKKKMIK